MYTKTQTRQNSQDRNTHKHIHTWDGHKDAVIPVLLAGWLAGRLAGWPAGWLAGWLTGATNPVSGATGPTPADTGPCRQYLVCPKHT